jgi:hypothetical protein
MNKRHKIPFKYIEKFLKQYIKENVSPDVQFVKESSGQIDFIEILKKYHREYHKFITYDDAYVAIITSLYERYFNVLYNEFILEYSDTVVRNAIENYKSDIKYILTKTYTYKNFLLQEAKLSNTEFYLSFELKASSYKFSPIVYKGYLLDLLKFLNINPLVYKVIVATKTNIIDKFPSFKHRSKNNISIIGFINYVLQYHDSPISIHTRVSAVEVMKYFFDNCFSKTDKIIFKQSVSYFAFKSKMRQTIDVVFPLQNDLAIPTEKVEFSYDIYDYNSIISCYVPKGTNPEVLN